MIYGRPEMDAFIEKGATQACGILGWAQSRWYDQTCLGFNNEAAFYRAGIYLWLVVFVILLGTLWGVRYMVRQIFP